MNRPDIEIQETNKNNISNKNGIIKYKLTNYMIRNSRVLINPS